MNRMTRYALALALGLSIVSTAAFAASPTQSASAAYATPQMQGVQSPAGPYDAPYQYLGAI